MQEIDSRATAVSAAVEQQSAASAEISQNVAGATDGVKLVVSVLDDMAGSTTTETGESTESVLTASQAVEAAAELRRKIEGFLAGAVA